LSKNALLQFFEIDPLDRFRSLKILTVTHC